MSNTHSAAATTTMVRTFPGACRPASPDRFCLLRSGHAGCMLLALVIKGRVEDLIKVLLTLVCRIFTHNGCPSRTYCRPGATASSVICINRRSGRPTRELLSCGSIVSGPWRQTLSWRVALVPKPIADRAGILLHSTSSAPNLRTRVVTSANGSVLCLTRPSCVHRAPLQACARGLTTQS